MTQLAVEVTELVEDGLPPLVRCRFVDAAGVAHEVVDKLAIVSCGDSLPADDAAIACRVLGVRRDAQGRRIVRVDLGCPWGCETVAGETVVEVFEAQLRPSEEVWIALNGGLAPAGLFGTNDGLNYGRFVHDTLVYEAVLPIACLDALAPAFAQLVDAMREDDTPDDLSGFELVEYRRTLAEAAELPDGLAEVLPGFFDRALLDACFPFDEARSRYVINATDEVLVVAGQILIRGRCWERRLTRGSV